MPQSLHAHKHQRRIMQRAIPLYVLVIPLQFFIVAPPLFMDHININTYSTEYAVIEQLIIVVTTYRLVLTDVGLCRTENFPCHEDCPIETKR